MVNLYLVELIKKNDNIDRSAVKMRICRERQVNTTAADALDMSSIDYAG